MPLLRTETIHGWVCKFYDNDRVMVGTTARRFTMNLPADETTWVATRLRAELIARELATAEELPIDEAGEAAMASKAAAKVRARATKAALKITIKAEAVQHCRRERRLRWLALSSTWRRHRSSATSPSSSSTSPRRRPRWRRSCLWCRGRRALGHLGCAAYARSGRTPDQA